MKGAERKRVRKEENRYYNCPTKHDKLTRERLYIIYKAYQAGIINHYWFK